MEKIMEAIRGGVFKTEIFRAYRDGVDDKPFDVLEFPNSYLNAGGQLFLNLLIGGGGTVFSNANAYIGVGDSSTAVSASQTDLQAASNKLRVAMDATFPSLSGQVMTWKATFSTSQANWTWNEVILANASSGGTALSRGLVSSPFTKTSALAIVQSYSVTIP